MDFFPPVFTQHNHNWLGLSGTVLNFLEPHLKNGNFFVFAGNYTPITKEIVKLLLKDCHIIAQIAKSKLLSGWNVHVMQTHPKTH